MPLYECEKLKTLGFMATIENMDGTLVAKVAQTGMDSRKNVAEVGAQVDIVAVILLANFVGAATGSGGGQVGALAGAGVV